MRKGSAMMSAMMGKPIVGKDQPPVKKKTNGDDEYERNIGSVMKADRERDSLIGIKKGSMYQGMSGKGFEYYDKGSKKMKVVLSPQATDADVAKYKKEMGDYYKTSKSDIKKPVKKSAPLDPKKKAEMTSSIKSKMKY